MPDEPMTERTFLHWLVNDYAHLKTKVAHIDGKLTIVLPILLAILASLVALFLKG